MNTNESLKDQLLLSQQYATGDLEAECDDDAFQECKLVGKKGGAKVLYFLGVCYHYGWGTTIDLKAAVKCYIEAAELGSFEALERLWRLPDNQSVKTDLESAFKSFCEKADQGDARAQFNAGYCYYYGIVTQEDKARAKDTEDAEVTEDEAKARDLFQMAADEGCADAMYMLEVCRDDGTGDGYNGMHEAELLKYAADMSSAEAQCQLGYAYSFGETTYGLEVEQDYKQAVEWFQKAIDHNHTEATYYLAECYWNGRSVKWNIKKSFELYKKAALMGYEWSHHTISDFYRHEKTRLSEDEYPVGIDYYEAAYWNRKAVDQGYDLNPSILEAIGLTQDEIDELMNQTSSFASAITWYDIAKQYEVGDGVEKDEKKAFKMYKLSARLGSIPAKVALGRCYEARIGVKKDLSQAIHWYEKAAMEGDHEAAAYLLNLIQSESAIMALKEGSPFAALAKCYETGSGVQRNEDTALLMREHAADNGDIHQARIVIEAYISGNGNEYRIRNVGTIVAKTSGLSREDYQQFIDKFQSCIDELDKLQILYYMAANIRAEIMGINIIFE